MSHVQCRIELANNLLGQAGEDPSSSHGPQAWILPSSAGLTERHFPETIGTTAGSVGQSLLTLVQSVVLRPLPFRLTTDFASVRCD